jgi:hypothetical protein
MLDCLQWLSVKARIVFNTIKFLWKLENNLLPNYLRDNLTKINQNHNYNLRNGNDYALPHFLKRCSQNSLFYKGLDIYNKFKQQNNCNNIHEFNKNCIKFAIVNSDLMFIHGNIVN